MKYLMIIAYILVSCSTKSTNNSTKNDEQNLIVIDVTKKHPEKIVYAQDIADIEYIPLETNDSTLIDRRKPDVVSEQYIVYHNQNGQVLVFNRQGKRLYSFNRTGGGPEEYDSIDEIVLDEKKKELYITNCELNTKIYVYSIDGTFKRKLDLLTKHAPTCLMNYDKDYLFCYNSYCMDTPDNILIEDDIKKRDNPYFFISKHTGEITPLKYSIPNRIVNRSYHVRKDKSGIQGSFQINIYPLIQNTSNIMITEFADDTLYSLKNKKLYPIMIKKTVCA
ncbi:6-bladed beta-propeller [Bacteroides thetaiotaomicron]|uniref:6-bladed beta-propeller n=1 Tax=Bacteroides thetaiotaomicron TaxID=818 RepID=UPI0039C8A99E